MLVCRVPVCRIPVFGSAKSRCGLPLQHSVQCSVFWILLLSTAKLLKREFDQHSVY